jgi:hypothetical protein
MVRLPRLLPSPLPLVRYVPEYRAEGALRDAYEDMKSVLQAPDGRRDDGLRELPPFFRRFLVRDARTLRQRRVRGGSQPAARQHRTRGRGHGTTPDHRAPAAIPIANWTISARFWKCFRTATIFTR